MENKMKSISALALSIALGAILFVTGTVNAQDEPAKEITVPGETGLKWVDTGIAVSTGDTIRLDAKGEVDVGGTWGIHGPEGTTNFSEQPPGYYPLETKLRYGLAAKLVPAPVRGKKAPTQTWVYGEKKEVIAARAGTLWLTVNDDAPEGNVGEFKVMVTIIKKKAK
jgi:hypothetical protein